VITNRLTEADIADTDADASEYSLSLSASENIPVPYIKSSASMVLNVGIMRDF
jgi:hypothetical protein